MKTLKILTLVSLACLLAGGASAQFRRDDRRFPNRPQPQPPRGGGLCVGRYESFLTMNGVSGVPGSWRLELLGNGRIMVQALPNPAVEMYMSCDDRGGFRARLSLIVPPLFRAYLPADFSGVIEQRGGRAVLEISDGQGRTLTGYRY